MTSRPACSARCRRTCQACGRSSTGWPCASSRASWPRSRTNPATSTRSGAATNSCGARSKSCPGARGAKANSALRRAASGAFGRFRAFSSCDRDFLGASGDGRGHRQLSRSVPCISSTSALLALAAMLCDAAFAAPYADHRQCRRLHRRPGATRAPKPWRSRTGVFSAVGDNAEIRALGRAGHAHHRRRRPARDARADRGPCPPRQQSSLAAAGDARPAVSRPDRRAGAGRRRRGGDRRRGDWISAWIGPIVARDQRNWRVALDAVAPDRPVLLRGFWGHTAIVNSAALKRIGIDRGRGRSDRRPVGPRRRAAGSTAGPTRARRRCPRSARRRTIRPSLRRHSGQRRNAMRAGA